MSSTKIGDYLTKQLSIEKNIVTYRSLSRALKIHVNVAKNELLAFHKDGKTAASASCATYLLSGTVSRVNHNDNDNVMDVDHGNDIANDEEDGADDEGEQVPQTQIILVGEDELEGAKSRFSQVKSMHVYSLSPSPIRDAGLICTPTPELRDADNGKDSLELSRIVGKIIGPHVKIPVGPIKKGTKPPPQPVAVPSKLKPAPKAPASKEPEPAKEPEATKAKTGIKPKEAPKVADKKKDAVKPKATGKLDFSKAKTKEMKKEEAKDVKIESKKSAKAAAVASASTSRASSIVPKEDVKRGVKRKSVANRASDSEDTEQSSRSSVSKLSTKATTKPLPASSLRVKNGVVLSDDEDDVPQPKSVRRKPKVDVADLDSDVDSDLKAMMDVDDDKVIRASSSRVAAIKEEEEEEDAGGLNSDQAVVDDDVEMLDDPLPVKKAPKKPKKVVPVGKNGIKKKRVVKSRTTKDAKGYMATEDYSSYESVDEAEPEPVKPAKGKGKAKVKVEVVEEDGNESEASIPPVKAPLKAPLKPTKSIVAPKAGASSGTKGKKAPAKKKSAITNFFGPESTKQK